MTYTDISTVNATEDLSNLLVYANEITNGMFMPLVAIGFFIVIFLGSFMMTYKVTGRPRPELSFASAGYATFGFVVLMSMKSGLINTAYVLVSLGIAILGTIWLWLSHESNPYG